MDANDLSSFSPDLQLMLGAVALELGASTSDDVARLLPSRLSYTKLKAALSTATDQGWLLPQTLPQNGKGWDMMANVREQVLAWLWEHQADGLRTLARSLLQQFNAYWAGEASDVQRLFLAVVAGDRHHLAHAWSQLSDSIHAFNLMGEFEPSAPALTRMGLLLRMAVWTGQWATFDQEQKLWLVSMRTWGTVWAGVPRRGLPELVAGATTEPKVLLALREWEVIASLVEGNLVRVRELINSGPTSLTMRGADVLLRYLTGDETGALAELDALLDPKTPFVPGPLFPFLACFALARDRSPVSKVKSWSTEKAPAWKSTGLILWAAFRHQGKADSVELFNLDLQKVSRLQNLDGVFLEIAYVWNGHKYGGKPSQYAVNVAELMASQGALWYQLEVARAIELRLEQPGVWAETVQKLKAQLGITHCLADLVGSSASWEASLKRLAALNFDKGVIAKASSADVLCWLVDPVAATVEAVLRKRTKSGDWSTPKPAPLTRLAKGDHPAIQSEDRPVLKALSIDYWGSGFDNKKALEALAGHPRLFLFDQPDVPLTLEAVEIELKVDEGPRGLSFSFTAPLDKHEAQLVKVGPAHWQVLVVSDKLKKVAEVVGPGLTLPPEARARVVEVLGSLAAGVQVRSSLLKENDQAVNVEVDHRPVILLTPLGEGLSVEVHVRPLGPGTPLLRPGEGPMLVHARLDKKLLTGGRDLKAERTRWKDVLSQAPDLDAGLGGGWTLAVPEPADALAVLAELRDAGEAVVVEWPKGGKIGLHQRLGTRSMKLNLATDHQWFSIGGEATIDGDRVVALKELLAQGAPGRFVRLADGDWVELEAQLMRQLSHLANVSERTAKHHRVAPWALASSDLLLDETVARASLEIDRWRKKWKAGISPNLGLPVSLTADLRPYQLDGFRWLARLAEVGAGACLADDMGLGKTVQAIALLAHRASEGPSLVVAPTSVAPNWMAEIRRFDRHLEPLLFSDLSRAERASQIASLGPGQVLVATYGLVVSEEELFTGRHWNVAVLDEAQAVKNAATKRSRAVLNLDADFRLAATGTPLQNHLGELWTLFEFLNPGLLGTKTSFTDKFWNPIEARGDEAARRSLKELVKPFLLRRTKNQVLSELPEKTETTLAVDLTNDERAFYEALRQTALDSLAASDGAKAGEKQILVLAQLMKLRRACCHPALAGGPAAPTSSKLDVLEELLESLLDNGHQALIFSQFTDHLALIQARLKARGWAYEYLDGTTTSSQRTERVARFQAGSASLFLISLQAGGTGLNLTAADYVVHMDPWWNPAVEDQASDRAHRMGQTRPVTIYRLVARDTIEERIVELHRTKRDLADALLEGTEAAARMGPEELLGLIQGVKG